jgi:hypothetical protein
VVIEFRPFTHGTGGGAHSMFWMIENRNVTPNLFGDEYSDMTFWKNDTKDPKTLTTFSA